uniref:Uncharacterized protein n=1 Tax=Triticum urartu TaxID=4572 RepID=A0A8R7PQ61_TRIUA
MNNWRLVGHAGLERFKTITSSYYLLPGSAWNHSERAIISCFSEEKLQARAMTNNFSNTSHGAFHYINSAEFIIDTNSLFRYWL